LVAGAIDHAPDKSDPDDPARVRKVENQGNNRSRRTDSPWHISGHPVAYVNTGFTAACSYGSVFAVVYVIKIIINVYEHSVKIQLYSPDFTQRTETI
jgi:hypothetical protein